MYVCTYVGRNEKSEPENNLNSLKRSRISGKKQSSSFARDEKNWSSHEKRRSWLMVHPQVLPNVKHKCFCFVCSFVRPCTRYRTTELPYVFPNIGLPWLNASRPTSSCHDSFRLDTSVSRYIQRPMHRTTPSFVSNSSALRTLPSSLFFPPKISHHLMDEINRSRYLYSFLHLDILLFIFHAVYRKREYFAILKNKLSPRDDKIDWLKKRKEREREKEKEFQREVKKSVKKEREK